MEEKKKRDTLGMEKIKSNKNAGNFFEVFKIFGVKERRRRMSDEEQRKGRKRDKIKKNYQK